jgi:hypothetical protein
MAVFAYFMNKVKSCKGLMDALCKSQERTVPACTAFYIVMSEL